MEKKKKLISLSTDSISKLEELKIYFTKSNGIGNVTQSDVVERAIKEIYENYLGGNG